MRGKIKKVFPGGNTSQGFYSFYDYIIEPDATRIFVIKGGPGVGKSTFMRKIGETMLEKGYDVEFHQCSSDNGSLDGICIPSIGIAMLDGTAPHVVDPKNPGAVDEIVHLGDFWIEDRIRSAKEKVLTLNKRVGRLFQIAYSHLKEAKVIHDEWESYITESMDFPQINRVTAELLEEIFEGSEAQYTVPAKDRHLFASAITPDGPIQYYHTLFHYTENLYLLEGEPGTGKSTIIEKVASKAREMGMYTEIFHCPFDPSKLDLVIIPQLKTALLNNTAPVKIDPSTIPHISVIKTVNLSEFIRNSILNQYKSELINAKDRFWESFYRAVKFIEQAKLNHDEMETFYIPAMDFEAINNHREKIIQRVMSYAAEKQG